MTKDKTRKEKYYSAVRRAIASTKVSSTLKDNLRAIVRIVAQTEHFAASILILDATRTKLAHSASCGLSQPYLRKGVLESEQSVGEISTGEITFIANMANDSRVQYPDMAIKAGIVSLLAVPIIVDDLSVGSLRVYTHEPHEFDEAEKDFLLTITELAAIVIAREELPQGTSKPLLQESRSVAFAHPSEEEFARLLDFYEIEWVYEPRSFLLRQDGEKTVEMFTPDFYLPALDLYIELTTLKQKLVTRKHRKIKRLKELYPDVKITLLHRDDLERLLARYGLGPLALTRAYGIKKVIYTAAEIDDKVKIIARAISMEYASKRPVLVGIQRGFLCFMADLIRQITVPIDIDFMGISYYSSGDKKAVKIIKDLDINIAERYVIIVEDIIDTGITLNYLMAHLRQRNPAGLSVCTLLDRRTRRIVDIPIDYSGFEAPNEFLVGYGLDYKEEYRNLPFIGIPKIGEDNKRPR